MTSILIITVVLITAFAAAATTGAFAATNYVVGDNKLWTTVPQNPTAYTDWASRQKFVVGDTLVFNFATDSHNVLQVSSRADFDNCNTQNPVASYVNGPATVNLNSSGAYYFICGVGAHCSQLRQAMTLTVDAVIASPTRPAPPPIAGGARPTVGTPPASTTATPPPTVPSSSRPSGAASSNNGHGKATAIAAVALTASVAALLL